VGELNGQAVKLAKVEGKFDWHHNEEVDELFFVTSGEITIALRDELDVTLQEGELAIAGVLIAVGVGLLTIGDPKGNRETAAALNNR
jgi:hypothetical protein